MQKINKIYFLTVFIIALLIFISEAFSFDVLEKEKNLKEIANSSKWLSLLHVNNEESYIKDSSFYVSIRGVYDPYDELVSFIKKVKLDSNDDLKCRFPARLKFLFNNDLITKEDYSFEKCPLFQEYIRKVSVKKISVVFATENASSPTSSMGHMFLKIDGDDGTYLPQHSLSFFAKMNEMSNPMLFVSKSLTSGTEGAYLLEPYGKRANAYLNEGRKLISYPLHLSDEDLETLVFHIWELKGIDIFYNLKNQNCASGLASLIAVVKDDVYSQKYSSSYMTPMDLIKLMLDDRVIYKEQNHDYVEKVSSSSSLHVLKVWDEVGSKVNFKISPAYNNLINDNTSFDGEFESQLFALDFDISDLGLGINKLDVINSRSFVDYSRSGGWSKSLEISLERESLDAQEMYPKVFLGRGVGKSFFDDMFLPYMFADGGYAYYENKHNLTISSEVGVFIYQGGVGKTHLSFKNFNSTSDYKYDSILGVTQSLFFNNNFTLYAKYNEIKGRDVDSLSFGFAYMF